MSISPNYLFNENYNKQPKSPQKEINKTNASTSQISTLINKRLESLKDTYGDLLNDPKKLEWARNYKSPLFNDFTFLPKAEIELIRVSKNRNKTSSTILKEPDNNSLSPRKIRNLLQADREESSSKRQKLDSFSFLTDETLPESLVSDEQPLENRRIFPRFKRIDGTKLLRKMAHKCLDSAPNQKH